MAILPVKGLNSLMCVEMVTVKPFLHVHVNTQ